MKTCTKCKREIITELPDIVWTAVCSGCHKSIYILPNNDCRQYKYEEQE